MAYWKSDGTITVVQGSADVTGVGANINAGDVLPGMELIIGGDPTRYEITAVSGQVMTVDPVVARTSASGLRYKVVPVQGSQRLAAAALQDATSEFEEASLGELLNGLIVKANDTDVLVANDDGIQIDVPVSGNFVQQGPDDKTLGRIMLVGSNVLGGKGKTLTSEDDVDLLYDVFSLYTWSGSANAPQNLPLGVTGALLVLPHSVSTLGSQIFWAASSNRIYFRARKSTGWNPWGQLMKFTEGTTGERPVTVSKWDVHQDETLGFPIYYNAGWKKFDGTAADA